MIKKIEIENLRGIAKGEVDELAPLTVLVGPNNSGKSTILEALWLGACAGDARSAAALAVRRGWCGASCVGQLQTDHTTATTVRLESTTGQVEALFALSDVPDGQLLHSVKGNAYFSSGVTTQVSAQWPRHRSSQLLISHGGIIGPCSWNEKKPDPIPCAFVDVRAITNFGHIEDVYSESAALGFERGLEELLARIGESQKLRILKKGEHYVLHAVTERGAVAAYFFGDGYKRLVLLACQLAASAGNVVVIEEPECFQHPGYLDELARLLWMALEQGTQIVFSTHSLDLLRRVFAVDNTPLDTSAVFKTQLAGGVLTTLRIAGARAAERLEELGEDLRR